MSGSTTPAGGASPPDGKLAASFQDLLERELNRPSLSDFERDVLRRSVEAGRVAAEDYEEANSRFLACMEASGFTVTATKRPSGLYERTVEVPQDATGSAFGRRYLTAVRTCSLGVLIVIESLYRVQQANPDLLSDRFEVAARGLVAIGAVAAGYTGRDFAADLRTRFADAPYAVSTPQVHACLMDAGFAIAVSTDGRGGGEGR